MVLTTSSTISVLISSETLSVSVFVSEDSLESVVFRFSKIPKYVTGIAMKRMSEATVRTEVFQSESCAMYAITGGMKTPANENAEIMIPIAMPMLVTNHSAMSTECVGIPQSDDESARKM
mmetsp:Transcript_5666/g.9969  ORF Transcript_5666/g.9969 Transcript_5666/m.9969 type:complete len:120 (-) Transcript_5666:306-665(-)